MVTTRTRERLFIAVVVLGATGCPTSPAYPPGASCESDRDCFFDYQACSLGTCVCDPARCRGQCLGSACQVQGCSAAGTRCSDPANAVCDQYANACYPGDGACGEALPCPTFGGAFAAQGEVACGQDRFCHIQAPLDERLADQVSVEAVAVTPASGAFFASVADVEFRWPAETNTIVAVVTSVRPRSSADLSHASWAAFFPGGSEGARWSDGASVNENTWLRPPIDPPTGPLYLVVAAYREGTLVRVSPVIAFRVGVDWPRVGSPCDSSAGDTQADAQCWAPGYPQVCYQNHCQMLCLSHRDCVGVASGRCGLPIDYARYCGIDPPAAVADGGSDSGYTPTDATDSTSTVDAAVSDAPGGHVCPSGNGLYCGSIVAGGDVRVLYTCTDGTFAPTEICANGCVVMPPGVPDMCAPL